MSQRTRSFAVAATLCAAMLFAVGAAAQAPAVTLNKTVGTVPGVCAATDAISVPAGTTVYYCYQAQNTGAVTFDLHDLADNELGPIFTNVPFNLPPGAFTPQAIVPDTATATVTNTGTWTAKTVVPFVDITTAGTALNLADDGEANIVLPFNFVYWGSSSPNLRVGNNGGIYFGVTTGDVSFSNVALPASGVAQMAIFPFWDDIDSDTGNVYWAVLGSAPNRTAVIEWFNRPHFSNVGSATFEVILYETTNAIEFRYQDTDFGNAAYNFGASATSGLQQNTTTAVQYSFNQPLLGAGFGLHFDPPTYTPVVMQLQATDTDTATVTVLFPQIDVTPTSLSATQFEDTVTQQPLTLSNIGQAPLDWQLAETLPDLPPPGVQPAPEPVFDVPEIVTSAKECSLFENYPGREPAGWAEFCGGTPGEPSGGSPEIPTSTGYLINFRTPDTNIKRFTLNDFPGQVVVGPQTRDLYGMDFDSSATTIYALEDAATDLLGTVDTATGAFTTIVNCPAPGGGTWTDLAIDPVTDVFYASTATNLYTLNPATCSPALVGPFGIASGIMIDLAVNAAGAMYGHDITTDSIYTINTANGAATLVGPTGYNANFAQGMDFDNEDGTLYIFLYIGTGVNHYGTVNLATGAVTPLASTNPSGEFEGTTQTVAFCLPTDYSWLSASPTAGTTPPGGAAGVTVTFDSTGITCPQTLTGQLCVRSNDPDPGPGAGTSVVQVPVTLTVECAPPSLSATKTVSGIFLVGQTITYTVTIYNAGPGDQADNAGDEFTDTLPALLTLVGASASSGTVGTAGNTVTWNGPIPALTSVTISIDATINEGAGGLLVSNQGTIFWDANGDGTNDTYTPTDDPTPPGVTDPTDFVVAEIALEIPTLSTLGFALLALALAGLGLALLRRRSA